jgi:seryl-tRNA synthetase
MVKKSSGVSENAYAKKALEAIQSIEEEAERKKREQLDTLREALSSIDARIGELEQQKSQVTTAIEKISGKAPSSGRRVRRNLDDVRDRLVRWLGARSGEKFDSPRLQKEFPELKSIPSIAAFLKKPIDEGAVAMEREGGPRSARYFVK